MVRRTTFIATFLVAIITVVLCTETLSKEMSSDDNVQQLMNIVDETLKPADNLEIVTGVHLKHVDVTEANGRQSRALDRKSDPEQYLIDSLIEFVSSHVLNVNFTELFKSTGRMFISLPKINLGKNSFLTGFGLGFLAFGLKKLLLPVFIGAQILKSVLIAAFLPTILGGAGKILSKGVTNFVSSSANFGHGASAGGDGLNDFEFKDTAQYNNGLQTGYDAAAAADTSGSETDYQGGVWTYPPDNTAQLNTIGSSYHNRYTNKYGGGSISNTKLQAGNYYTKDKTEDFKVFHNIPASSHLLANYDPFYSPLLSRIDTVFKQLGYTTEPCRERLVCQMYKSPAKFAPYSNLISAQLSRELNELRKPSTENPEILRFFKYMKAAKDGQDGQNCELVFSGCATQRSPDDSVPMMTTYNEINKLVQARHAKQTMLEHSTNSAEISSTLGTR
ncbi:uncharacterized protein LOC126903229 [Daktulosphaira vitifoliae]|uniref:uncharacterized protein LOC126903229 n=1 Tax=Daktulosphaira vitifoliae TaxID=58002 RepID=UPI0021A9C005|nr:uncharacterized protein LOC126903229 [Daktulosphaira vitifoliae]